MTTNQTPARTEVAGTPVGRKVTRRFWCCDSASCLQGATRPEGENGFRTELQLVSLDSSGRKPVLRKTGTRGLLSALLFASSA